ncbi:hypothetical protein OSB04_021095 [Centaurea solstitialis]|uniref:Uncharacterized protein n=1 Tax=Centaurea solstitialis TaxID=347529 RepID=A0AA38W6H4_9ASTR|nr:hypothetical protein OSB04_021095 [Centaurea solstitialis]
METELIKHQWNSNLKPQPSLGFFGILKESFKTANRNRKLLFPVLVLAFLSFSQLNFAEVYLLEPVAEDFSMQLTNHPKMVQEIGDNPNLAIYSDAINDIRKLSLVILSILALDWIINLVFLIATVSSSSKAYTSKPLDPKEMISNIRKSYKNLCKTSICLVLITLGLVCLGFFSLGIVFFLGAGSSSAACVFSGVVSIWIVAAMCFYYSSLWMMSMVVSVLEDVGGLAAIVRAKQLIKVEKVRASMIMVLVAVVYFLVHFTNHALPIDNLEKSSRLAVTIPFGNGMICILKLFMFVVFTVFYHERKESFEEKEGKDIYVPIAALEVEVSKKLCLDYIIGNIEQKLKIRPSETKSGNKMRTKGFEPGVNGSTVCQARHSSMGGLNQTSILKVKLAFLIGGLIMPFLCHISILTLINHIQKTISTMAYGGYISMG